MDGRAHWWVACFSDGDIMTPEFLLNLLAIIAAAAGSYAAIKADLTRAIVTAEQAIKDADKAHNRIDDHINEAHRGRQ